MAAGGEKEKKRLKKVKKEKKVPVPSAQDPKEKGKLPRRSRAARSGDAVRVSAKDGEPYAKILKAMNDETVSREEIVAVHRTGQTRPWGPVQFVQALRRCADCGGPFNQVGRSELARVR